MVIAQPGGRAVLSSRRSTVAVLTRFPIPDGPLVGSQKTWAIAALVFCFLPFLNGCSKIHHEQREVVYVWTRQMYLRDRVAAVSNRVAEVSNGQELQVLEHGKRFLRVKTEKNEVGWIPDRAVIDSKTHDAFVQLANQHKGDTVVATGTLRDDIYLHVSPGRDTDRFYLLPGNAKVQMLIRASVIKTASPTPAAGAPTAQSANAAVPTRVAVERVPVSKPATQPSVTNEQETSPVAMEDWWLIRDTQGRAGWVLGNRVDTDVPDDIAQYAEGQRIVGAYVIARVHDEEANSPDHEVAEYVTALAPPKSGLLFDFDQIRVFTWSLKRHRYETAFRIHPIQGYLPVRVTSASVASGPDPVFSFQISSSPDVAINPETGIARPANPRTISYELRDTQVRRVGPDMAPIPTTHSADAKARAGKSRKKRM
jgi:hypothetical protein